MPYATHEEPFIVNASYAQEYPMEMDLCNLLETMRLGGTDSVKENAAQVAVNRQPENVQSTRQPDVMQDDNMEEDMNYHSDTASEKSSSSSNATSSTNTTTSSNTNTTTARAFEYGCAYLRVIHEQMQDYPTTNGEYLDAIFTHREILYSYPAAHHGCARAFSDLAYEIEQRAWRADREADMEAVTAFRHEAWMIASTLAPVPTTPQPVLSQTSTRPAHACIMMPMA